jgi:hypothetical protein
METTKSVRIAGILRTGRTARLGPLRAAPAGWPSPARRRPLRAAPAAAPAPAGDDAPARGSAAPAPGGGAARALLRGVCRSLGVVGLFVGVGLSVAGALRAVAAGPAPYTGPAMPTTSPPGEEEPLWLVDGFNLLHVGVLRGRAEGSWWGPEGRRLVLERAASFRGAAEAVVVVFDGPHPTEPGRPPLQVVFAPSADDWLLARVREAADPGRLRVVTADRRLAARAQARGARVIAPAEFLGLCGPAEEPGDGPPGGMRA